MSHDTKFARVRLLTGAALLALVATPVMAQTTPNQPDPGQTGGGEASGATGTGQGPQNLPSAPAANNAAVQEEAPAGEDVVVTGSILRTVNTDSPSPVTTLTAESFDQRGVSTVQDALQQLASNNGPALTNSFTANGAFAAGASAVSLRGLSTNSTLVLFDGQRAAYYPLADDGSRNFVDLNTIPDDIVERVEVLRDGASASYGADAIAGVVNIITKKEFKGVGGRAEAGISQRGDAAQYRLSLTAGVGDLAEKGVAAYLSGFYFKSETLYNRDRPYPFNSDDLRNVCAPGASPPSADCGPDNRQNGFILNAAQNGYVFGGVDTAANFLVRPANPATNAAIPGGRYVNLSPCSRGSLYTLTAAEFAANANAPSQVCQVDYTNQYGVINPEIERFGASGRVTAKLNDDIEAYGEVNFLQSRSSYTGTPASVRANAPTGINFRQFSTSSNAATFAPGSAALSLPVFVCPERVNCATSPNRTLNPNNPFAAAGQSALLIGRDLETTTFNQTRTRAYRAAFGVAGDITDRINFDVTGTAMHVDLRRTQNGYVYIQHLLDVINDGTYNFRNPSATPQSVIDYLKPDNITDASSDLYQIQGTLGFTLADLPGGPFQVGVGGQIRYEAVDAPSANPDANGPTQRYFTLNAFGTTGDRTVYSAFAEAVAPIFDQLEIRAAGRYDKYSSGQDAFSPKVGAILRPIDQITIRGTYSRGFRIPSFGEANALPTTGYVTNTSALFNDTFLAQYGCTVATFAQCPAYIRAGSYGQTSLASPDLDPEKSRSFTASVTFEPIRRISFSVDYFNIKKTGAITQPTNDPALQAYYTGQAIPAGYTVIPDAPDINFPNATPRVGFVQAQLVNANTIKSEGLDFSAVVSNLNLFDRVRFTSSFEASYIIDLSTTFPDGTKERYEGTLGNFNLTAGSGTPEWHGSWQNTLDFGDFILTGTAQYFGGYNLSAMDQGTDYKDCGLDPGYSPEGCNVKAYITFDLNAQVKVNDKFTVYATVNNVFDDLPPIDVVTYGAHLYNPVQGGLGILGRYVKAGVRVGF